MSKIGVLWQNFFSLYSWITLSCFLVPVCQSEMPRSVKHHTGLGFPICPILFFTTVIVEFQFHILVLTEMLTAQFMLFHSFQNFLGQVREAEGNSNPQGRTKKETSCSKLCVLPRMPKAGDSQLKGAYPLFRAPKWPVRNGWERI